MLIQVRLTIEVNAMSDWLDLHRKLCATPGVSGFEDKVATLVSAELRKEVDSVQKDQMGNIFGTRRGLSKNGPTIMVTAHMDEVGLIVKHIEETGFLRVQKLGGVPEVVLQGQRVVVCGRRESLPGLVGQKPAHIMSEAERKTIGSIDDLYVDIGAANRKEAEEFGVEIGTPITFDREFCRIGKEFVTSKAIDNRVGVTAMLQIAKQLVQKDLESTLCYVGTVQEEVGLRGARVATERVRPDVALVLDGLHAGGTPDVADRVLPMRLGRGPAVTIAGSSQLHGFIANRRLRECITQVAGTEGIPLQHNVGIASGVSDSGAVHLAGKGVATSDILIVRRYSHSPIEMVSLSDIENAIRLAVKVIPHLDSTFIKSLEE
jgi:endoglucanase